MERVTCGRDACWRKGSVRHSALVYRLARPKGPVVSPARSSLAATVAAVALLGALAPAAPAAAVTGTTTVSFRNSRADLPDDIYRAQLQGAKAMACQPAFPPGIKLPPGLPPSRVTAKKVSAAAAIATANQVAGVNPARSKKLKAQQMARTTVGLERLAAAGVLNRAGNGALAALLMAATTSPRDPLPLINAAALLIDAGKPNEALALLDKAQTLPQRRLALMGINSKAILETNRSAAQFRTGQFAAAVATGRRALKLSPWLVEARENIGMSLLCLNKEEEAICEFREAAKRPLDKGEERLSCVGHRDAKPADFGFTVNKPGVYPPIGYPALPSKTPGYVDYYARVNNDSKTKSKAANDEFNRLTLKVHAPKQKRSPLSRSRGSDIYLEMLKVPLKPAYVAQLNAGEALRVEVTKLASDTSEEMHRIISICADQTCVQTRCKTLLEQNHPVFLNRQTQIETTMRAWWRDLHAEMSGLAQGIGDADENALAITQIDEQGLIGWDVIQAGIPAWNGTATLLNWCFQPLPDPSISDATVGPDGSPLNPCPPSLDKLKAKFDIAGGKVESGPFKGGSVGAGIQVKCSEVSVYADAKWSPLPLLSGFGKMGYANNAQGGTLTIGIGSKAGIGPVDFQSGLQLTVKSHYGGTDVDLAWRVGPTIGPASDIVDITIFKSVAMPQASPTFPGQ